MLKPSSWWSRQGSLLTPSQLIRNLDYVFKTPSQQHPGLTGQLGKGCMCHCVLLSCKSPRDSLSCRKTPRKGKSRTRRSEQGLTTKPSHLWPQIKRAQSNLKLAQLGSHAHPRTPLCARGRANDWPERHDCVSWGRVETGGSPAGSRDWGEEGMGSKGKGCWETNTSTSTS